MKGNFEQAFKWLMVDEGGYTNDPSDSGGATKYGITIGDYKKYLKKGATPNDVKTLTLAQAETIYRSKYWSAVNGDTLPSGVDNAAFNYGVLAGIGRPITDLKKFSSITDPDKLIDAIADEMQDFLSRLSSSGKNTKFRKGWLSRVSRMRKNSHYLAAQNKDVITGPGIGSGLTGFALWASQTWHNHEYLIIGGGVTLAVLAGIAIHLYRNRK